MALGGGTFITQNKELPGAYINFVSAANASASLSDRGIVTMPLELDWGVDGEVFEVSAEDFQKNSLRLFGYDYTHPKLKGLRDLFKNSRMLYAYKLTSGGDKASNTYAEALYGGVRGNDIKIAIQTNADNPSHFDVRTILGTVLVDEQTVANADALRANAYVKFKPGISLTLTAGTPLENGTNGTVNGTAYQNYLNRIEAYSFNAMGLAVTDNTTKDLFVAFVKRMRDEAGIKFQLVLHNKAADYFGVVNVKNTTAVEVGFNEAALVYWVTGALGGCPVNKSCQNKQYDGEFSVNANFTQSQLKATIKAGEFTLHKVGSSLRVLEDINSKTTVTDQEGEVFRDNQSIRVIDQIANDIAVLFNGKYLGAVPNDNAGRISLWSDIVKHHTELNELRAIENFSDSDVVVAAGSTKKSVVVSDAITVVNAMSKLYMTVTVA